MKALLSTECGGPETLVLGELPEPTAGPGQVVVAVKACSINFPDTLMIENAAGFDFTSGWHTTRCFDPCYWCWRRCSPRAGGRPRSRRA